QLTLTSQRVEPPDTQLTVAAIDIDDSPSMAYSDPQRVRAGAAQLFWQTLLGAEPRNQCALLDFGGPASPGFDRTRLLNAYTSAGSELDGQLASIQPLTGSTPLYQSALEVVHWTDTTLTEARYGRYVVIMTDGMPTDTAYRDALFAAARASAARPPSSSCRWSRSRKRPRSPTGCPTWSSRKLCHWRWRRGWR